MTQTEGRGDGADAREGMRRRPIEPWRAAWIPRRHDEAFLERFVAAALSVLRRTGVRVLSERALSVFRENGAAIDERRRIARLSEELVRGALVSAPRSFILGSRDGSCDLDLASGATFMTSDGCGMEVIDWRGGERRASTKADLADITRMQDYVSCIAYWWPTVGAGDCGVTAQLHELDAGWNNTVKHLQGMVQGGREARFAVAMAEAIAGGRDELRRRPPLSDLTFMVSPLTIDRDGGDAALAFAEAGVPVVLGAAPAGGTTGPATHSGLMTQALAEVLALVTLVQLAYPGAPVVGYPIPGMADPRSGGSRHSLDVREPNLSVDLVHYLGLPSQHGCGGGVDTETPGSWTEAAEGGSSLALAAMSGSELVVGLGLTGSGTLWSCEDLILDDQLYHQARHAVMDLEVDDGRFALDVIDAVGPGGHFMAHPHTRRYLRESFVPGLTSEPGPKGGYRDPVEVARERAVDILEHYQPGPLDDDTAAALTEVLAAADDELKA